MGALREILVSLFRRPTTGDDNGTPQQLLPETVLLPPPPTSARRDVVVVWQVKVLASISGSALLSVVVPYPSGVTMFSDELPGMFGDKPDVSCEIGGLPAFVVRFLRGASHMGFEIQLPDDVSLADQHGQSISLVWSGAQLGVKNSVVFRLRAKKA